MDIILVYLKEVDVIHKHKHSPYANLAAKTVHIQYTNTCLCAAVSLNPIPDEVIRSVTSLLFE